ncbi:ommochrome-binding protein [Papilio machaon]|uniref:ommochrome-binding protein n=1 Tax=Papilio machaon TaxID=76193 RepID=UPI001E663327|nr:ommochrome-binding protein [Papilio machaon]
MNIIIVYFTLFVISSVVNSEKCDGIYLNNKFHRKEVLSKNIDRPYQLSYDKHRHRVYFSYNIGKEEEDRFNIAYIEKGNTEHKVKDNIENGFAIAIDNINDKIYFGGSLGIYEELIKKENETKKIIEGFNVWDMFIKEKLHFINYPQQRLYKCEHEESGVKAVRQKHIHEKIYQYAIDGHGNSYITNRTGLYMIKNGTSDRIFIKGINNFRCIEVDNDGVVHFCGQHGIYVINKEDYTLEKIAEIRNIFGLTFDHDNNFIYSNPHEIVKLLAGDCK